MPQIVIDVEARVAQALDGLDRVASAGERAARRMDSAFKVAKAGAAGLVAGLSVQALVGEFKGIVDSLTALNDASTRTGASVEELSSLLNTLKPHGANLGQIADVMGQLTKSMAAAGKSTEPAAQAFKALNVSTRDAVGNLKPAQVVLEDVARALSGYADDTNKVVLAQALFGKAGADLLPMLKNLSEEQRQEASVTQAQAAQAERLAVAWAKLDGAAERLKTPFASKIIQDLARMTEAFEKARSQGLSFFESLNQVPFSTASDPGGLQGLLRGREEALAKLAKEEERLTAQMRKNDVGVANRNALAFEDAKRRLEALSPQVQKARDNLQLALDTVRREQGSGWIPKPPAPTLPGSADDKGKPQKAPASFLDYDDKLKQSIGQLFETADVTRAAEFAAKLETIDKMFFDGLINAELYDGAIKALTRSTEKVGGDGIAALEAQAEKWRDLIDPTREVYKQISAIDELVKGGFLSKGEGSDATTSMLKRLEDLQRRSSEETKTGIDLAKDFGVTMTSSFENAVFGAGKLSDALKGLANDIARLMFRKTAIEPAVKWVLDGLAGAAGGGMDISTTDLGIGSATRMSSTLPKSLGIDVMNEAMIARSSTRAAGPTIVQHNTFSGGADPATLTVWAKAVKADTLRAVAEQARR